MRRFSLADLEAMPIIEQGQFDNLVYEAPGRRVWWSRMTRADGAQFDRGVTCEMRVDGFWRVDDEYEPR